METEKEIINNRITYSAREKMLAKLNRAELKLKSLSGKDQEKQKIILQTLYEVWNDCFAQNY